MAERYYYVTFSGSVWVTAESREDAASRGWECINDRARDVVELDSVEEGPEVPSPSAKP